MQYTKFPQTKFPRHCHTVDNILFSNNNTRISINLSVTCKIQVPTVPLSFWQNNWEMFSEYGHIKTHYGPVLWKQHITNFLQKQAFSQWTDLGSQVTRETEFFMAAPNTRSSSAHNLIHVTVLKPGILWQLLEFFKNSCTLDLSKTLPAFTSPDQIPQTVYL